MLRIEVYAIYLENYLKLGNKFEDDIEDEDEWPLFYKLECIADINCYLFKNNKYPTKHQVSMEIVDWFVKNGYDTDGILILYFDYMVYDYFIYFNIDNIILHPLI